VANVPYPNNPPPGTNFNAIWVSYPFSLYVGLYVGNPVLCPPPDYMDIPQASFPGYQLQALLQLKTLSIGPGPQTALQRFTAVFPVLGDPAGQVVAGWFVACLLSNGEYVTLGLYPFDNNLLLSIPGQELILNAEIGTAPSGQMTGQGLQSFTSVRVLTGKLRMAYVFRKEQRAALKTAFKALNKCKNVWDPQVPRAGNYRGVLSNTKIFPNELPAQTPPTVPNNAYLTMVGLILGWITDQLEAEAPIGPP